MAVRLRQTQHIGTGDHRLLAHEPAFATVAKAIEAAISRRDNVSSSDIRRLECLVRSGRHVDYETAAEAFAQRYLMVNFWKVATALEHTLRRDLLFSNENMRVLDLGAGSGASTLALLASVAADAPQVRRVSVTLVDRSERHMTIARDILEAIRNVLPVRIEVSTEQLDLDSNSNLRRLAADADVVLASHLLTEMDAERAVPFAAQVLEACAAGALAVFIERLDDPLWHSVLSCARQTALPSASGAAVQDARYMALNRFEASTRRYELPVAWVSATVPDWPWVPGLVRRYFRAWRQQSVELLDLVFAPEASYHEHPDEPRMEGLDAIRSYWRRKVLTQRDPEPEIVSIAYGCAAAHIEWRASTVIRGRARELAGSMILEVDPDRERVIALREYFTSHDADSDAAS